MCGSGAFFKDILASIVSIIFFLCALKVSSGAAVSEIGTKVRYSIKSTGRKLFWGRFGICYYFFQIQTRQMQFYAVLQEQLNTVAIQIS